MARKDKNIIKSTSEYTMSYDNMRGVSFSEKTRSSSRFEEIENMYIDYDGDGEAIETIPGFRCVRGFFQGNNSIFIQDLGENEKYIIVHSRDELYRFSINLLHKVGGFSVDTISMMNNRKSIGFCQGKNLYIIDGEEIVVVDEKGECSRPLSEGAENPPYIPTTFKNGKKSEARNLLTSKVYETYEIEDIDEFTFATAKLIYRVIDESKKTCAVMGISSNASGKIFIPSFAEINGEKYKVTEIGAAAFKNNSRISEIITSDNLEIVRKHAFSECGSLTKVILSDTVKRIEYKAFHNLQNLSYMFLGIGLEYLDEDSIVGCPNLTAVDYGGDERDLLEISDNSLLSNFAITHNAEIKAVRLSFPLKSELSNIIEITLDGNRLKSYEFIVERKLISIDFKDKSDVVGKTLTILGEAKDTGFDGDFLTTEIGAGITPKNAILGCTLVAYHDDHVFLSGNPSAPGAVFYSSTDSVGAPQHLYFSSEDYFIDGNLPYSVVSLISANGELFVFKSDDDGSGSIFCHKSEIDSKGKLTYPITYTHGGIAISGPACNFYDDMVFLTPLGVCALEKVPGSSYKKLVCRSSAINAKLLREDLSKASLCEWRGYLAVCIGPHIYLADSRDTFKVGDSFEYEWYFLNDIGTYANGETLYRYSNLKLHNYNIHPNEDGAAEGQVLSNYLGGGVITYYVIHDKKKYGVIPTYEYTNGTFSPLCYATSIGQNLLFFTESGDLCTINNDMRGVAPDYLKNSAGFDEEEYKKTMGNKIHPFFYNFERRKIRCVLKTVSDSCDLPYLKKNTVNGSLVLKCKTFSTSTVTVGVITDNKGYRCLGSYSPSKLSFSEINFKSFSFTPSNYAIVPIHENEKGWVEKQFYIHSEEFNSPIGIYSINYRYKIKGKIKP